MPFNRALYPDNWEEISHQIRFVRAQGRCEWIDERGERCEAVHLQPHPKTGSKVVLTTAHLEDENPMNCAPENLLAMCQLHHFAYDRRRRKKLAYIGTTERNKGKSR